MASIGYLFRPVPERQYPEQFSYHSFFVGFLSRCNNWIFFILLEVEPGFSGSTGAAGLPDGNQISPTTG
jgi:hypothetical protein